MRDSVIDFSRLISIIQTQILPKFNNVTEVKNILQAVIQFPTPAVMEKFSAALGWVNLDSANWSFVGYYDYEYPCALNFFILDEVYNISSVYYSLILVCFNLLLSVAIFISCILVTFEVSEKEDHCFVCRKCLFCCCFWKECIRNVDSFAKKNAVKSAENRKIFRRITFILITDLLCWIPVCIISLVVWCISSTEEYLNDLQKNYIAFKFTFIILLCFNSILNPYLYSYHIWSGLYKKSKQIFYSK